MLALEEEALLLELELEEAADLRVAGTLRLMFSSAV